MRSRTNTGRGLTFQANYDYFRNQSVGYKEEESYTGQFGAELENSDVFNVTFDHSFERFVANERISGATIPIGTYNNPSVTVSYNLGPQRPYKGNLSFKRGRYYDGTLTSVGVRGGRVEVTPQLSVEPSLSFNWIHLPSALVPGDYNQHVAVTRVTYTISPRAYVSALVQYNSGTNTFSENFRLRWEWAPGSELFVVYTEDRNTDVTNRWSELQNRGLVVKINRLLRL